MCTYITCDGVADLLCSLKEALKLAKADPIVAFLGRIQSHWVEQLVLPVAAVGFSMTAMVLFRNFVRFLVGPDVVSGWVLLFGLIVSVVGVYGSNFVTHARAPILTHFIGGFGVLFVLYTILILGGAAPLSSYFSKASLLDPNIFWSLGIVFLGWILAVRAGIRFARIGTLALSSSRQTEEERKWIVQSSISTSGMYERRRKAVSFFKRRTLWFILITAGFTAVAFDDPRVWEQTWMTWRWSVAWAMAGLIFFGLVQQGVLVLYELRMTWADEEGEMDISDQFVESWVKSALSLAGIAVGVALLLPSGFALFDFRSTAKGFYEWSGWFFSQGVNVFNRYVAVGRSGGASMRLAPSNPFGAGGILEGLTGGFTVLYAAVAVLVAALFLAGVISLFLRGEWRKLSDLLRVPGLALHWVRSIVVYIGRFGKTVVLWLLRLFRGFSTLLKMEPRGKAGRSARRKGAGSDKEGAGYWPDSYIRKLFVQLIYEAQKYGHPLKKDQTPHEFAGVLRSELKGVDEDMDTLVDRYVEARYGRMDVQPSTRLEKAWAKVVDKLRGR